MNDGLFVLLVGPAWSRPGHVELQVPDMVMSCKLQNYYIRNGQRGTFVTWHDSDRVKRSTT